MTLLQPEKPTEKRDISEKVRKAKVLSLQKSGPSVKIRFGFWGFLLVFSEDMGLKRDLPTEPIFVRGSRTDLL